MNKSYAPVAAFRLNTTMPIAVTKNNNKSKKVGDMDMIKIKNEKKMSSR
jgi:hypothetical protein